MDHGKNADRFDAFENQEKKKAPEFPYWYGTGGFSKHLMEKTGLMRYANETGKTRIVIEYNNNTGEGLITVFSSDPIQTDP